MLPTLRGFITISNDRQIVYDEGKKAFHVKGVNKIWPLDSILFCEYDCKVFICKKHFQSVVFSNLKANFCIGEIFTKNDYVWSIVNEKILSSSSFTAANPKSSSPNGKQYATLSYFLKSDGTRNRKTSLIYENMINYQVELIHYHPYNIKIWPGKEDGQEKMFIGAQVELVTFKEK